MRKTGKKPRSQAATAVRPVAGAVSRRDFIRLNAAWIVVAGTSACTPPDEPADERNELNILRADDLLSLRFELRNLRVAHTRGRPGRLVRIRADQPALVIVRFPGQHVAEQAYPDLHEPHMDSPAWSQIAGPTRLAFRLPDDLASIELTMAALLQWREWTALLSKTGNNTRLVAPGVDETAIELPYGLQLSPDDAAYWAHAIRPVTYNGRTELWHTRLVSGDPGRPVQVAIRAPRPRAGDGDGVLQSLTPPDREALAGKTAAARQLILSPYGGWLDVDGAWEVERGPEKWRHIATAGQDQRVLVQYAGGFLYPFGHSASLLTLTERKLYTGGGRTKALLRQSYFVVVKQRDVTYEPGAMAFQGLHVVETITPSLYFAEGTVPSELDRFWINTAAETSFDFRMRGTDWADREVMLDAPAIFLARPEAVDDAKADYELESARSRRTRRLNSQSTAVAPFQSTRSEDTDGWGEPLSQPRSEGDTTLYLISIEFGASPPAADSNGPPFMLRTAGVEAKLPALDPYLSVALNHGWFTLVDPEAEGNQGEVFARFDDSRGDPHIPMHFDQQSDRCGGVATPSFDVGGLSRVRGPVGDPGPLMGKPFDPASYFNPDHANLFSAVPLAGLLAPGSGSDNKSPLIPSIRFGVAHKQPKADGGPDPSAYYEVSLGLNWTVPLGSNGIFVAEEKTSLSLDGQLSKRLGEKTAATDKQAESGADAKRGKKKKPLPVDWKVSGKVSKFALNIALGSLGELLLAFDHLALSVSTPKTKQTKDGEKKEGGAEIDFKIAAVKGNGLLLFIEAIIALAAHLPTLPKLPVGDGSNVYPARLADVSSADLAVIIGPIEIPKKKWTKFELSNVAVSVGVGLFFFPRGGKPAGPPMITLRVSSQDKPMSLIAEPWGGLAHFGANATTAGIDAFRAGLGIIYKCEVDLGIGKAKVEVSLSCIFTYIEKKEGPSEQIDVVLQVCGQALLAGFIDVYLVLVADGTWQGDAFYFSASVTVRIKIAFFTLKVGYAFSYQISGQNSQGDKALAAELGDVPAELDSQALTEGEWRDYRAAFAGLR